MLKSENGTVLLSGTGSEIVADYVVLTRTMCKYIKKDDPNITDDETNDFILGLVAMALLPTDELRAALDAENEEVPF